MELIRHTNNPILLPNPTSSWETYNVFNPAVIFHQGEFHMLYRAQGLDWVSRLGYAHSTDGIHFTRDPEPAFSTQDDFDARGIEDPRITEIDGVFYMAYTAYGNRPHPGFPLLTWAAASPLCLPKAPTCETGNASDRWW